MLYQIYNSEGEQVCLVYTKRIDNENLEKDIKSAFEQVHELYNETNLDYIFDILERSGIERVYTEELTI